MNAVARDLEYAAHHVRSANHSTVRGFLDGPQACAAVGNLAELVQRLPQVLGFLACSLRWTHAEEHYDDRGRDPADTLTVARGGLLIAHDSLPRVLDQLIAVHDHLGHLGRQSAGD